MHNNIHQFNNHINKSQLLQFMWNDLSVEDKQYFDNEYHIFVDYFADQNIDYLMS